MRRAAVLALLAALAFAGVASGCGEDEEEEHHVVEGETLELGDLDYRVELTRFLNPDDLEDSEYLVDQPSLSESSSYLGVFLTVLNETDDESLRSASDYAVTDIRAGHYEPVASESPYALDIGGLVPPDSQLPLPDSTAANGPARGGLLVFEVEDIIINSRPLVLEIESDEGGGEIQLDI